MINKVRLAKNISTRHVQQRREAESSSSTSMVSRESICRTRAVRRHGSTVTCVKVCQVAKQK